MRIAGLLKALATGNHLRVAAGDDIALAQQGTPPRFAISQVGGGITRGEGPGVIEMFVVINRLLRR
ncbi:hypothetical protein ALO43_200285 [Pseudomonas tremae]|uniref:Uncharacterized protein n=1 Tax=Pseudomonas tremae TaxID=200454 RepID=A0AA40P165_9PSED|nr:hypothetical protein ALO43_200285 [Pseudomonas tremae]